MRLQYFHLYQFVNIYKLSALIKKLTAVQVLVFAEWLKGDGIKILVYNVLTAFLRNPIYIYFFKVASEQWARGVLLLNSCVQS